MTKNKNKSTKSPLFLKQREKCHPNKGLSDQISSMKPWFYNKTGGQKHCLKKWRYQAKARNDK